MKSLLKIMTIVSFLEIISPYAFAQQSIPTEPCG